MAESLTSWLTPALRSAMSLADFQAEEGHSALDDLPYHKGAKLQIRRFLGYEENFPTQPNSEGQSCKRKPPLWAVASDRYFDICVRFSADCVTWFDNSHAIELISLPHCIISLLSYRPSLSKTAGRMAVGATGPFASTNKARLFLEVEAFRVWGSVNDVIFWESLDLQSALAGTIDATKLAPTQISCTEKEARRFRLWFAKAQRSLNASLRRKKPPPDETDSSLSAPPPYQMPRIAQKRGISSTSDSDRSQKRPKLSPLSSGTDSPWNDSVLSSEVDKNSSGQQIVAHDSLALTAASLFSNVETEGVELFFESEDVLLDTKDPSEESAPVGIVARTSKEPTSKEQALSPPFENGSSSVQQGALPHTEITEGDVLTNESGSEKHVLPDQSDPFSRHKAKISRRITDAERREAQEEYEHTLKQLFQGAPE